MPARDWCTLGAYGWCTMGARDWCTMGARRWCIIPCPLTENNQETQESNRIAERI